MASLTVAQARADYLDSLGMQNKSLNTTATYRYAIDRFLAFLAEADEVTDAAPLAALNADMVRRFALDLYHRKLSAATRSTYLVVLRNWFRYLTKRPDLAEGSPVHPDLIELPKNPRAVPSPDERLPIMLSTVADQETDSELHALIRKRDIALLETLFATQLRVSELVSLNKSSIDWSQGIAVVTGKGRKVRTVFFSESALAAIEAYVDARKDSYLPLFLRHDRAKQVTARDKDGASLRLTRQSVEMLVRKYARLAGVEATPHSFRHYGATELLRNGADIRTVQELLGHASVQTTQIYTHVSPRRLQQEWRRYHPAAGGGAPEAGGGSPVP